MKHLFSPSILAFRYCSLLILGGATIMSVHGQSFAPVSNYSTGVNSTPEDVAVGDVNGDGRLDIVSANFTTENVGVLLGQANGFAPVVTYPLGKGAYPTSVALGDVNGDGRLDIVSAFGSIGVQLGQANGSFAGVTTYASHNGVGAVAEKVILGDVNGDGRLDIISANPDAANVGVLLGQTSGFAPVSTYSTGAGTNPFSVALGDINNDGRLDLVTANGGSDKISVLLGQSNGFATFSAYSLGTGSMPKELALGDVNGDGRLDVVTANHGNSTVSVLLGQVTGSFTTPVTYNAGSISYPFSVGQVSLRDANGDGRLDIVTSITPSLGVNGVGILLGQTTGFGVATTYASNVYAGRATRPNGMALGDMNGDGRLDIVTANIYLDEVGVLFSTGALLSATPALATASRVVLYPNPAHNSFRVHGLTKIDRAELYNSLGQLVFRPSVSSSGRATDFQVEAGGLSAGIYTLRLQVGEIALTKRVVIE